jgi:hypothetical protein
MPTILKMKDIPINRIYEDMLNDCEEELLLLNYVICMTENVSKIFLNFG